MGRGGEEEDDGKALGKESGRECMPEELKNGSLVVISLTLFVAHAGWLKWQG